MSSSIHSLVPDSEVLLALEPEELAGIILQCLKTQVGDTANRAENSLNRDNFISMGTVEEYPQGRQMAIQRAMSEAWSWLERECLLAHRPGERDGWVFITRRAERIRTKDDFQTFLKEKLLPKELLHPAIAEQCQALIYQRTV